MKTANDKPPETTPEFRTANAAILEMMRRELDLRNMGRAAKDAMDYLRPVPDQQAKDDKGTLLTIAMQHRVTTYRSRHNAVTGEPVSWYVDFLANADKPGLPAEQALRVAETVAQPPEDAELVESGYETQAGRTFFRARWEHLHDGLPVEGDYIEVLVNGQVGKAFSWSKVWREPNLGDTFVER